MSDSPATQARPARQVRAAVLTLGASRVVLELKAFFREKDAVVFIFLFPIVMLALFAIVFGSDESSIAAGATDVNFAQYFLPGMIAAGIALDSFQTLATSIAVERDEKTLKQLRGTPMPPVAYFLGKIGMVLAVSLLQVAVLLAVAAIVFGVPLPTDFGSWLTFAWIFALGTAAGTVLGIAYSSVPRSAKAAGPVVAGPVLVLMFVSGVFFVYSDLPGWLQDAAAFFPLKWIAQGMRSVFLPEEFASLEVAGSWEHGTIALVLTAWLVAGLVLCTRTFRWQRRDDR